MIDNLGEYDVYYAPVSKYYGDRPIISYPYSYKSVSHPEYSIEAVRTLVSVPTSRGYGVLTVEDITKGYTKDDIKPSTVNLSPKNTNSFRTSIVLCGPSKNTKSYSFFI